VKRRKQGWPSRASDRHSTFNAAAIDKALGAARPAASDAALAYWRDKLWQAAETAGLKLTDDQLEAMAADLVVAARNAPGDDE
jgi:hypothetical protein